MFGMLNKCNRYGRNPVVLLGLITHFVAFYLIFLNIANDAPVAPEEGTPLQAYITPRYKVKCKEVRDGDCKLLITSITPQKKATFVLLV